MLNQNIYANMDVFELILNQREKEGQLDSYRTKALIGMAVDKAIGKAKKMEESEIAGTIVFSSNHNEKIDIDSIKRDLSERLKESKIDIDKDQWVDTFKITEKQKICKHEHWNTKLDFRVCVHCLHTQNKKDEFTKDIESMKNESNSWYSVW